MISDSRQEQHEEPQRAEMVPREEETEQEDGRPPLVLSLQLVTLEEGVVKARGEQRVRQLAEELLDETGHVVRVGILEPLAQFNFILRGKTRNL